LGNFQDICILLFGNDFLGEGEEVKIVWITYGFIFKESLKLQQNWKWCS